MSKGMTTWVAHMSISLLSSCEGRENIETKEEEEEEVKRKKEKGGHMSKWGWHNSRNE
jgi:hypothetical protein